MNVKIHYRNLDASGFQQKLIERQCKKVERLLPSFQPDALDLTVTLEKLARGNQHRAALTLALPQRVIRVEEIEDNPNGSLIRSFEELLRRLKKFKSQLSRERLRGQKPLPAQDQVPVSGWEVENLASENLEKIENYIRRELYHQVVAGLMPPGVIEPLALVDDVFLEVTANAAKRPSHLTFEQWMFQVARRTLKARITELEDHRDEPHVEDAANESNPWEDEDLNFYQPDESLQLEDLLRDGNSLNPEELIERDEMAAQLQKAIARLPESQREAFILFVLEGFTSDEVAMVTGKTPDEVVWEVGEARAQLRGQLQQ
ncbi:MAG: sigma-70 family RNA polymerase sigma factor [Acidobacteriota bacterium]|nr:MAG: sigma-70 family RNA polymerase sigma factor [Acidobacteriota bacterium]